MRASVTIGLLGAAVYAASALAGQEAAEQAQKGDELLYEVYMREDVQRYCTRNPDAIFQVEVTDDLTVAVRCRAWHDWRRLQNE